MDIDKVIQNLREAKKKASCPPGFRYSKKMNMCVPTRKYKGKYKGIRGYYIGGGYYLSLIHICRCRRSTLCRSRWSPYH